jgi:hypothetical protein
VNIVPYNKGTNLYLLFDLLTQIVVGIKVENVSHKVKGVLVVGNLSVQVLADTEAMQCSS